jgi:hypothetical protein
MKQPLVSLEEERSGYTKDELKKRILDGQREIRALDPKKQHPPLYLPPWRGKPTKGELADLFEHLRSLMPTSEKVDF